MNGSELVQTAFILAGLLSIPFVAGTFQTSDSELPVSAFSLVENSSSLHSSLPYSFEKQVSENKLKYVYKNGFEKIEIMLSPEAIKGILLAPSKKLSFEETYFHKYWKLEKPEAVLEIEQNVTGIYSRLSLPCGKAYARITANGNFSKIRGTCKKDEVFKKVEILENEMKENMKKIMRFIEKVEGIKKVEISYLKCKGGEDKEYIEIRNTGDINIDLKGWKIRDSQGSTSEFVFANKTILEPGNAIKLYRNITGIIWNDSGDRAILISPSGEIVSTRACDE